MTSLVPPNDVLPNLRLLEQMWHALADHPPKGYHLQVPEIVEYGEGRGLVKGSLQWVKDEALDDEVLDGVLEEIYDDSPEDGMYAVGWSVGLFRVDDLLEKFKGKHVKITVRELPK